MSKRDTFKKNILGITRSRNMKRAVSGWELVKIISLSGNEDTPCELCGTRFREGAKIRRSATNNRKELLLTVGGTCLETILRGSFADGKQIAERKKVVNSRLKEVYGRLVEDPGNWIKWLKDHAPTRLKPLIAQLQFLGMVQTDRDLNRLIAFHDAKRKYPVEAILPNFDFAALNRQMPKHITIDESRAILKGMTYSQWINILRHRKDRYYQEQIEPNLSKDTQWQEAYKSLDTWEKRAVVAMAALSDDDRSINDSQVNNIVRRFEPVAKIRQIPFLAWCDKNGLALIVELSDEIADVARAWIWKTGKEQDIDLLKCRVFVNVTEDNSVALQRMAFWEHPVWYSGRMAVQKRIKKDVQSKVLPQKNDRKEPDDEYHTLSRFPCFAQLFEIARYKGHMEKDEQIKWAKQRVRALRYEWSDLIWQAGRYSTSPDCREKVDNLMKRLSIR